LKGIYVLIIKIEEKIAPRIGALGRTVFSPGLYAYVGSAQSNLGQRISRHLRKDKLLFWHIDYLLNDNEVEISKVFFKNKALRIEECRIADLLKSKGEQIKCFGSSDCKCGGHLFHIEDSDFLNDIMHVFYEKQS
jgi:Uri superfamily endonuclease